MSILNKTCIFGLGEVKSYIIHKPIRVLGIILSTSSILSSAGISLGGALKSFTMAVVLLDVTRW